VPVQQADRARRQAGLPSRPRLVDWLQQQLDRQATQWCVDLWSHGSRALARRRHEPAFRPIGLPWSRRIYRRFYSTAGDAKPRRGSRRQRRSPMRSPGAPARELEPRGQALLARARRRARRGRRRGGKRGERHTNGLTPYRSRAGLTGRRATAPTLRWCSGSSGMPFGFKRSASSEPPQFRRHPFYGRMGANSEGIRLLSVCPSFDAPGLHCEDGTEPSLAFHDAQVGLRSLR
jgi:hypothetical protein